MAVDYINKTSNNDGYFDLKENIRNNIVKDIDSLNSLLKIKKENNDGLTDSDYANNLERRYNPFQKSKYDEDISWTFHADESNDVGDLRAEAQGNWGRLKDAAINNITIAGTTALSSSIGLAGGVVSALVHGDASKIWDNDFNNALNDIQKGVLNNNQIYKGQTYQNKSFLGKATDPIFWAELFQNAGYMEGMLIPGTAIGKAAKATQIASKFPFLTKVATNAIAAGGEASMEAINQRDESYNNLFNKATDIYRNKLTIANNDVEKQEAYSNYLQDLKMIDDDVRAQGNRTFAGNMAILTTTGFLEFGDFVSRGYAESHKLLKAIERNAAGQATAKGIGYDIARGTGAFVKNFAIEGGEEYTQRGAASGAANTKKANSFLEKYQDEYNIELADNYIQAMASAWADDFNNEEAWLEFLSGALMGGIGIPGSHNGVRAQITDAITEGKARRNLADQINKAEAEYGISSLDLKNNGKLQAEFDYLIREAGINKEQDKALVDRDTKKFVDTRVEKILNLAMMYDNAGEIDEFKERIKQYSTIDNQEQLDQLIENTQKKDDKGNITVDSPYKNKSVSEVNQLLQETADFYNKVIDDFIEGKQMIDNYSKGKVDEATLTRGAVNYSQAKNWETRAKELLKQVKENIGKYKSQLINEGKNINNSNIEKTIEKIENLDESTFIGYFLNPYSSVNTNIIKAVSAIANSKGNIDASVVNDLIQPLEDLKRISESYYYAQKDVNSILNDYEKENKKTSRIVSAIQDKKKNYLLNKYKNKLIGVKSFKELRNSLDNIPTQYRSDVIDLLEKESPSLKNIVEQYKDIRRDVQAYLNANFYYTNDVYKTGREQADKKYGKENIDSIFDRINSLFQNNLSFEEIKEIINNEINTEKEAVNSIQDETLKKNKLDEIKKKEDFFNVLSKDVAERKQKMIERENADKQREEQKKNEESKSDKGKKDEKSTPKETGKKKTKEDLINDFINQNKDLFGAGEINEIKKNVQEAFNSFKNERLQMANALGDEKIIETTKKKVELLEKLINDINSLGKEQQPNQTTDDLKSLVEKLRDKIKNKDTKESKELIDKIKNNIKNKKNETIVNEAGISKEDLDSLIKDLESIVKSEEISKELTLKNNLQKASSLEELTNILESLSVERLKSLNVNELTISIADKKEIKSLIDKIIEVKLSNLHSDKEIDEGLSDSAAQEKLDSDFYEKSGGHESLNSMQVSQFDYYAARNKKEIIPYEPNIDKAKNEEDRIQIRLAKKIQEIVSENGGYDFVDSGKLAYVIENPNKRNLSTLIKYIRTVVNVEDDNGNLVKRPIYLLAIEDKNGNISIDNNRYQIVGSLARMTYKESDNPKSAESYNILVGTNDKKGVLDEELGDWNNQDVNTFVVSKKYSNAVKQINAGRIFFDRQEQDLENYDLDQNEFEIGYYNNGNLVLSQKVIDKYGNKIVKSNDFEQTPKDGTVIIFIKGADGRLYPRHLNVNRLNETALKNGHFGDSFIENVKKSLRIIADPSKVQSDRLFEKYNLSTMFVFSVDEKTGFPKVPISFGTKDINGNQIPYIQVSGQSSHEINSNTDIDELVNELLNELATFNLRANIHFGYNNKNYDNLKKNIVEYKLGTLNLRQKQAINCNFEMYLVDKDGNANVPQKPKLERRKTKGKTGGTATGATTLNTNISTKNVPSLASTTEFNAGIKYDRTNDVLKIGREKITDKLSKTFETGVLICNLFDRDFDKCGNYLVFDAGDGKEKFYTTPIDKMGVIVKGQKGLETIEIVTDKEFDSALKDFNEKKVKFEEAEKKRIKLEQVQGTSKTQPQQPAVELPKPKQQSSPVRKSITGKDLNFMAEKIFNEENKTGKVVYRNASKIAKDFDISKEEAKEVLKIKNDLLQKHLSNLFTKKPKATEETLVNAINESMINDPGFKRSLTDVELQLIKSRLNFNLFIDKYSLAKDDNERQAIISTIICQGLF